ncbi:MAG: hypothetical protein MPK62_03095 [Alphaproteobacteria bacterium]|nr:hypothetical protein [Alphaproteobacteria bacterium]MDA8030116.1 hypothetical protein [Alphaproteobacteria bacterium]
MIKGDREGFDSDRFKADLGYRFMDMPPYFPAISGPDNIRQLDRFAGHIESAGCDAMMVSAYDIHHAGGRDGMGPVIDRLNKRKILFMDSGGYEAQGRDDWDFDKYRRVLEWVRPSIYASYDVVHKEYGIDICDQTLEYMRRSLKICPDSSCAVVCHGDSVDQLIEVVSAVASCHPGRPAIMAVPDRECGRLVREKMVAVKRIKDTMDLLNDHARLHILGCDDPVSGALLEIVGADSVDGTGWYKRTNMDAILKSLTGGWWRQDARRKVNLRGNVLDYMNTFGLLRAVTARDGSKTAGSGGWRLRHGRRTFR